MLQVGMDCTSSILVKDICMPLAVTYGGGAEYNFAIVIEAESPYRYHDIATR